MALIIITKIWKQPMSIKWWTEKENVVPIIVEHYSTIKRWDSVICDIMDKTGGCNVKWNNPGTERQVLNYFTHVISKKVDPRKVESIKMGKVGGREGRRKVDQ
jgi:hypothetical protein